MENPKKHGLLDRFLSWVERAGNKLPDPTTLFILLGVAVVVISGICGYFGVSAVHPGTKKVITAFNLFSKEGVRMMWSSAVVNFSSFAPFGMVMVCVIGAGAAEKSGFLAAFMQKMLKDAPPALVTMVIIFIGINGNIAGDAAFVVMPPLAAAIYLGLGRNPLLGMFVAFASVAAGFCANVLLGMSDALAYGFTEAAARLIDPGYTGSPAINYYFLVVSCILLTITGTLLTEKVMVPRFSDTDLAKYRGDAENTELTPAQNKGLKYAGFAFIAYAVVFCILCFAGSDPVLAEPGTGSLMSGKSPFMQGIILSVTLMLFIPGAVYGFVSGKYKNDKALWGSIADAFRDMAPYILLCFFCAQFTSYFAWSNLGAIIAVKGAGVLTALHFTGIPLIIGLVIISCIVNIFIGSASAKWAILAPIFVPMMMLMNLDPAVTQVAYRIGDSITNPLSPLFYYFPLILGFARRYEKNIGMGTIIANMIPFSMAFTVVWLVQLVAWVLLDLPLGPGGPIFLH